MSSGGKRTRCPTLVQTPGAYCLDTRCLQFRHQVLIFQTLLLAQTQYLLLQLRHHIYSQINNIFKPGGTPYLSITIYLPHIQNSHNIFKLCHHFFNITTIFLTQEGVVVQLGGVVVKLGGVVVYCSGRSGGLLQFGRSGGPVVSVPATRSARPGLDSRPVASPHSGLSGRQIAM